jgi:O-methyltransferase
MLDAIIHCHAYRTKADPLKDANLMILHPKQTILRAIQRAGYIVQKLPEYRANEQKAKEVQEAFVAAHVELVARRQQAEQDAGKLRRAVEEITGLRNQTTNVEARNAELRQQIAASYSQIDALQGQLTASRSEIDALQGQLTASGLAVDELQHQLRQARGQEREFHNRLVEALDEIRRLKIRVEELPEIDYQILMREQHERAAFQDTDAGFMPIFERVKGFSMTSIERLYAMYKATEYVCRAGIPGSIVESGVWRGGSMMMAALTLQALGDCSRQLILFDTFEGLPKPNDTEDVDLWGHSAYDEWTRHRFTDESSDWAAASLEEVRANLLSTGYPSEKLIFIKGMVQNTLLGTRLGNIALLRLDTDWYESTVCELQYLYPLLSENGVLIIDDYGHLRGQKKAVDEYFANRHEFLLLHRIDYSGRVTVKSSPARERGRTSRDAARVDALLDTRTRNGREDRRTLRQGGA